MVNHRLSRPGRSPRAAVRTRRLGGVLAGAVLAAAGAAPAAAAPQDCADDAVHIEVSVSNVRRSRGHMAAVFYDGDPRNFLAGGRSVSKTQAPAAAGVYRICVDAPAHGTYALIIYHDENGNREFDLSLLGTPQEGVGFSNNPPSGRAIPDHGAVAFPVDADRAEIEIRLNYP